MKQKITIKTVSRLFWILLFLFLSLALLVITDLAPVSVETGAGADGDIKWVDFDVSYEALCDAMKADIESYETERHFDWVDLLAYLGARYGGDFSAYRSSDLDALCKNLRDGASLSDLTADMKYFSYYQKAYGAVLSGLLGEFSENGEEKYGLKAFSPIASGYGYTHYDDFGNSRSYGYQRKHFGHDLMLPVGVPVVAVESGVVEALGWNQYGGWRIGIRSDDGLRYHYYAHLRKDHPYNDRIFQGMHVTAGEVIGYTGQTGYSLKENVNNIDTPHLHYGIQLIFNEAEKDSPNQIWVDLYALTKLLSQHQSSVFRPEGSKDYYRAGFFEEQNYYREEALREEAHKLRESYEKAKNIILSDPPLFCVSSEAASSEGNGVEVPILMYHALVREKGKQNAYFIDPGIFASDLRYLKEHGYTTVVMSDLIAYTEGRGELPEKPVVLTFDDGYYNNYLYAYPLLRENGMKAVISAVGKFTDDYSSIRDTNEYYAHLSWEHLREMAVSGVIEVQNHSYDLHYLDGKKKAIAQRQGETDKEYAERLRDDFSRFQTRAEEFLNETPTTLTYPYGAYSEQSEETARALGFKATLSCREGMNRITRDPQCLYQLKRYLRSPERDLAAILPPE